MADTTLISWTDATYNPWIGCMKVSPGCDNCYAARQDAFRKWTTEGWGGPRRRTKTAPSVKKWNDTPFFECAECSTECAWRGECNGESCGACGGHVVPARRRVFCASLADWLDNEVDVEWLVDLLDLIRTTPNLDWQLLTKRIGNWRKRMEAALAWVWVNARERLAELQTWIAAWLDGTPPANVWLGATIVNQTEADRDVLKLLAIPARIRFLSMEPLLGRVDLTGFLKRNPDGLRRAATCSVGIECRHGFDVCPTCDGDPLHPIDLVIAGGESGPDARPSHPQWFRDLCAQCEAAGVPFHFKQWGEWASVSEVEGPGVHHQFTDGATVRRVGVKVAGRLLGGREWNGVPQC